MNSSILSTALAGVAFGAPQTSYTTLKEAGAANGVLMGSQFNLGHWSEEPYKQIFGQEYAIGTAENACKWGAMRHTRDSFDLGSCVDHLKQAMANKQ